MDDSFDRRAFHDALQRGSAMLFDNAGVRVRSDDIERAYRWYAAQLGRALQATEYPQALCAWVMEGRPDA